MANMFGRALDDINSKPQPNLSVEEVGQSIRNFMPLSGISNPLKGAVKYGRNAIAGIAGKLGSGLPNESTPSWQNLPADYTAQRNKFIADEQGQRADPIADVPTTFGSVGLPKMGPGDLSKLSNGAAVPVAKPAARKPASNTPVKTAAAKPIAAPDMQSAGDRAYEYKAPGGISTVLSADEIKSYSIGNNGGIASMDGKTFILPSRGADEEAAYQKQQAEWKKEPITAIAAPAPQTTTVGTSQGGCNLAPGENLPPEAYPMNAGQLLEAKAIAGLQNKRADTNSKLASIATQQALLPSQINQNNASARHANVAAEIGLFKAPAEVDNIKAVTAQHTALTNETNKLVDLKAKNMISEIDYRKGMLGIGNQKLGLLTKQYDARITQMKQSKDAPDYKLIADIAKNKMKTYQEISVLNPLTPVQQLDMQKQNDILNLVQRHATKSSTQYGGAASITDDDN